MNSNKTKTFMNKYYSIHKAAAVLIRDRKLLVERSAGKEFFVAPGGKLEKEETPIKALVRELNEELGIEITGSDCTFLDTYYAQAANSPEKPLRMDVYIVVGWNGEILAKEAQELAWITSENKANLPIGSIFEHDVVPLLKAKGVIE